MLYTHNKIIAHRGASAYAPENTMAAFNKAFVLGARFFECDVMLSADNQLVVFHDETLKRTTSGRGCVSASSLESLQKLDAGTWFSKRFAGEKIPLLSELLQWLVFTDTNANIELKPNSGTWQKTTMEMLSQLYKHWPANKPLPLISSFEWEALQLCRSLAPEMPLALLLDTWETNWLEKAKELRCYSIHFNRKALNAERVQAIKGAGFFLFAYTVNRKRQAKKLFEWGVDAVFSDYPDLLA